MVRETGRKVNGSVWTQVKAVGPDETSEGMEMSRIAVRFLTQLSNENFERDGGLDP